MPEGAFGPLVAFTGGLHAARPGFRDDLAALGPDLIFDDMRRLPGLLAGRGAQENP